MMREYSADDSGRSRESIESQSEQPAPDPSVLESVLRQTLTSADEPLTADELAALQRVVAQFPGEPFALEPHGVALVEALLKMRLLTSGVTREVLADVSREVAGSLAEVPDVWQRVANLWRKLGGGSV
jgi:hypothetical protein